MLITSVRCKGRPSTHILIKLAFFLSSSVLQFVCCRVKRLLERAPRSIKLVADQEPLEVVAEDEQLLVVCKPAGVRSAPVHRFQGNSMLSRMIGHLGHEPHLLHR
jgi:23S rRNA-/tRNA-specific pseudouridylate synthase